MLDNIDVYDEITARLFFKFNLVTLYFLNEYYVCVYVFYPASSERWEPSN